MTPWVRCIRMVRALQGQEETFEMYFRMKPPMFPAATLPFPSAGDLRFRAQGMWVGRDPGCRSFHSLCPGLGSSCPDGAFVSTVFITSAGSNRLNQINPYSTLSPFRKSKTSDFFEVNIRTFDAKHPYFCPKKSDVFKGCSIN